jgi:hypothetical protein
MGAATTPFELRIEKNSLNMIVTPFLAGSFDLIAGEFLASNRKTKTNKRKLSPSFYP